MTIEGRTIYCDGTFATATTYREDENRSPVEVLIDAVAEAADVGPVELPPVYDYVDPDAVNRLFEDQSKVRDANTHLSFKMESWYVFINANGDIRVYDATKPSETRPVFRGGNV